MNTSSYITISRDQKKLPLVIKRPVEKSNHIVIFVHGMFSNKDTPKFVTLSRQIVEKYAFHCLLYDYRCHGENPNTELTILGAANDFLAVYHWAVDKGYEKISVIATSFGASLVLLCLQEHDLPTEKLIFLNPLVDYDAVPIPSQDIDKIQQFGQTTVRGIVITRQFHQEFNNLKPYKTNLDNRQVFFVQSRHDDRCPLTTLLRHYGKFKGQIHIVDSDHSFNKVEDEVYAQVLENIS